MGVFFRKTMASAQPGDALIVIEPVRLGLSARHRGEVFTCVEVPADDYPLFRHQYGTRLWIKQASIDAGYARWVE